MRFADITGWVTNLLASIPTPSASPAAQGSTQKASPFRIAVVGSGVAGARAAHRLSTLVPQDHPVSITVFEAADRVGGRLRSVVPPGEANARTPPLEAGAPFFFADDWCLSEAVAAGGNSLAGLASSDAPSTPESAPAIPAVWSPAWSRFRTDDVCHRPPAPAGTWDRIRWSLEQTQFTAGIGLTYGVSPWAFSSAASSETAKWQAFASETSKPFTSIHEEFSRVGLTNSTTTSADRYLATQNVGRGFPADLVQPCAQGFAGHNLSDLSGLAALLPSYWGSRRPVSVSGGNSRLIESLLTASGAEVKLSARVIRISPGHRGRYQLLLASTSAEESPSPEVADFDAVLLAAPLHGQDDLLSTLTLTHPPPAGADDDYAAAHVTHFASRLPIPVHVVSRLQRLAEVKPPKNENNEYVFVPQEAHVPLPAERGFVSLSSTVQAVVHDCPAGESCAEQGEVVHRVVSREALSDDDVLALLGLAAGEDNMGFLSWVERAEWPVGFAGFRKTQGEGEVEIADGLYYLSGAEGTVGTLEMACRMGRNAADLVGRRWASAGEQKKDEL